MQGIRVDPQDFIRNAGKALGLSSGPQPGQAPHQAQQNHLYSNSTNFVGGSSPFASPPPTKAVSAEALEAAVLQQGKGHHGQGQSNYSRGGQHPGQHGRGNQAGQYGQQRSAAAPYNPTGQQGGYGAGAGAGAQPYAPPLQSSQQQQPTANLLNQQQQQQAQIAAALQQLQQMQQMNLLQNIQQQQQQQAAAAHQGGINLGGSRNDAIANNPIAALASLMSGNMQLLQQQHLQQQAQQSQSQQQSRHPFSPQQQSSAQQQSQQQVPQGGAHKAASSQLIGPSGLALNALASPFSSLGPGGAAALFAGTNGHNAHIPAAVQSAFSSSNANNGGAPPTSSSANQLPPLPPSPHSSTSGQHHPLAYASPAAPPAPITNPNVTGRVGASGAQQPPASTPNVPDLSVLTTPPPPVPSAGSTRAAGLKQAVGLSTPTTATGVAPARPVSPPSVTSSRAEGLESLPYTAPGSSAADAENTAKVVLQLKNVETATEKQITQFVQQGFGNIEGLLTACLECEGAWYAIFKDEETAHAAQQNVRNKILADAKPFTKLLTLRQLPKALQRTNNWKSNAAPAENCGIWNRSGTSGRDSPPKFRQTAFPGAPGTAPVPGTPVGGAPGQGPQVATPVAAAPQGGDVSGFQQATEQAAAAATTTEQAGVTEGSRAWTATEKGKYKEAAQFARLLPVVQIPGPENGAGRGFAAGRGRPVAAQGATGNNLPMSR